MRFSDDQSVVPLGIGKNMVSSVRYWMKSLGLIDDGENLNEIAEYLFSENGKDPFLEDIGSIWLLHYFLVKTGRASIYNLVFNDFRKGRIEFTKDRLHSYLKRKCHETGSIYNANTVNMDISVFRRNYMRANEGKINIEDDFSRMFIDLELITHRKAKNNEGKTIEWLKIESGPRKELPYHIVLYTILDNPLYGNSVTFKDLQIGHNSPGLVFAINAEGLFDKIEQVTNSYPQTIFTETAGIQVLQVKSKINKLDILNDYYNL